MKLRKRIQFATRILLNNHYDMMIHGGEIIDFSKSEEVYFEDSNEVVAFDLLGLKDIEVNYSKEFMTSQMLYKDEISKAIMEFICKYVPKGKYADQWSEHLEYMKYLDEKSDTKKFLEISK